MQLWGTRGFQGYGAPVRWVSPQTVPSEAGEAAGALHPHRVPLPRDGAVHPGHCAEVLGARGSCGVSREPRSPTAAPALPAQVQGAALHRGGLHPGGSGAPEGAAAAAGGRADGDAAHRPLLTHLDPHVPDGPRLAPVYAGEPLAGTWPPLALGQVEMMELEAGTNPHPSWRASPRAFPTLLHRWVPLTAARLPGVSRPGSFLPKEGLFPHLGMHQEGQEHSGAPLCALAGGGSCLLWDLCVNPCPILPAGLDLPGHLGVPAPALCPLLRPV